MGEHLTSTRKTLDWMNGRRHGYIKTVKCLFLRKKTWGGGIQNDCGHTSICIWAKPTLQAWSCTKSPGEWRGLLLTPVSLPGVRSQHALNQSWLFNFWAVKQGSPWPPSHLQRPTLTSEKQGSGHLWTTGKRWIRRKEGKRSLTSKQNQARTEVCIIRAHHYIL